MGTTSDEFLIGGETQTSRLIMGSGGFDDPDLLVRAIAAGGAQIVTAAVRRVEHTPGGLFERLRGAGVRILPNTAGCATADEAVRTARLAREALGTSWVKLEVVGNPDTLMPDPLATVAAAATLADEGFVVLPYVSDDPELARHLERVGCAAVMPLGAPIGSGLGVRNPHALRLIRDAVTIPVIVDAGIGTASDAALAMELGCDAVLAASAIARARSPVGMAESLALAVRAGRAAYRAGRITPSYGARGTTSATGLAALSVGP